MNALDDRIARLRRLRLAGGTVLLLVFAMVACGDVHPRPTAPGAHGPDLVARVPTDAADGVRSVRLLLRLRERRLYVLAGDLDDPADGPLASFPVAIGRRGYETPVGEFEVTEKVENPDWVQFDWHDPARVIRRVGPGPDNPLGERWIGFASAHGWGIGFHGTPHPELLGQAVSHGCVRMRNRDVVDLYDRVEIGTPVVVRP